MGDERLGGALLVVPVAGRQAHAADVQVPGRPHRSRFHPVVEHVEGLVAQRVAVGDRGPLPRNLLDGEVDRPDRRLRGTTEADHPQVPCLGAGPVRQAHRDPVAAEHRQSQRDPGVLLPPVLQVGHQHLEQRWHRVPHRHVVFAEQVHPPRRVPPRLRFRQHQGRPRAEDPEDVEDGQVEAQRGQAQHRVGLGQPDPFLDVHQRVQRRGVGDGHPLRRARRSRGVDDVGDVARVSEAPPVGGLGGRGGGPVGDHQRRDALGPLGAARAVHQQALDARVFDEPAPPRLRELRVDRHVGAPGGGGTDRGDDLPPPLAQADAHHAAPAVARLDEPSGEVPGAGGELGVGEHPVAGHHRGPPGGHRVAAGGQHPVGEQPLGHGPGGVVGPDPGPQLLLGQRDQRRPVPPLPGREAHQQFLVGLEHLGHHPVGEQLVDGVPGQLQATTQLQHEVVDGDLRGLGDEPGLLAQPVQRGGHRRRVGLGGQRAGEHDRHQPTGGVPPQPVQLPQDAHPADVAVFEVLPAAPLHLRHQFGEGVQLADVHLQQLEGGELPDRGVDVRVERQPVDRGEVQREVLALAPPAHRGRVGGQQHAGGGDAVLAGAFLDARPHPGVQAAVPAHELRRDQLAGRDHGGQLRRGRQLRHPFPPVLQGPLVQRRVVQGLLRQHVVPEGQLRGLRGQLRVLVELPPRRQDLVEEAGHVGAQQVEADVGAQPPVTQPRHPHLPQRPGVGGPDLGGHPVGHLGQQRARLLRVHAPQVQFLELVVGNVVEDALPAVGQHDDAQHLVAANHLLPGPLQPRRVEGVAVELQVQVRRHPAHVEAAEPADPLRLLHLVQRERLVPALGVGHQHRELQRRRVAVLLLGQQLGEPGHARPGQQLARGHRVAQPRPQPVEDLRGQQRVPAEFEEVVVHADRGETEELLPQLHQGPLGVVPGCHVGGEQVRRPTTGGGLALGVLTPGGGVDDQLPARAPAPRFHPVALPLERVPGQRDPRPPRLRPRPVHLDPGEPQPGQRRQQHLHVRPVLVGAAHPADDGHRRRRVDGLPGQGAQRVARSDLDEDALPEVGHRLPHRLAETHRLPHVRAPVAVVGGALGLQPPTGHRGPDRQLRRPQRHLPHLVGEGRHHRVDHRRVEGVRGPQQPGADLPALQGLPELRDRLAGPGHHAQRRSVDGGDRQLGRQQLPQLLLGQPDGEHVPTGQVLHQPSTRGDQPQRVAEVHHPGQAGRDELAEAVPHHRVRRDTPAQQLPGQGVLGDEQRRLGQARLLHGRGRRLVTLLRLIERGAHVEVQQRQQDLGALVHGGPEHRLRLVQATTHPRVLGPLPGEEEDHLGRGRAGHRAGHPRRVRPAQQVHGGAHLVGHQRPPEPQGAPTQAGRGGHVGEPGRVGGVPLGVEVVGEVGGGLVQGLRRLRGQQHDLRAPHRLR